MGLVTGLFKRRLSEEEVDQIVAFEQGLPLHRPTGEKNMTEAIRLIREEFERAVIKLGTNSSGFLWSSTRPDIVRMFDLASAAALKRWNDQRAARTDSVLEGDK